MVGGAGAEEEHLRLENIVDEKKIEESEAVAGHIKNLASYLDELSGRAIARGREQYAAPSERMGILNATSVVWVTVVATSALYALSAAVAFGGSIPGPYVSVLTLAPLGLMASSLPLFLSVLRVVVPDARAIVLIVLAYFGTTAFQAAVLNRRSPTFIGVLALLNLALFLATAKAQGALTEAERQKRLASRERLAAALSRAVTP